MRFARPVAKSKLEKILLDAVERDTPAKIKSKPLIDLNNKNEFVFTLKKEHLEEYGKGEEALGIMSWFNLYKEEAKVSTAGIRGLQNPLYPWDTRYPLNLIGVMLATMGKVLVAKDIDSAKVKVAASEVRYNSRQYVELIARIQAAYDIKTYVTQNYGTIPIFMISFIIFMNDLYGGEYVTSSHAMCKKIATKDLNTQGSQYIPSESLRFVDKVAQILQEVEEKGEYTIKISSDKDKNIDRDFLVMIKNGINDYVEYLKKGIATPVNIKYIKDLKKKIVIDTVGGSFTQTFKPVLKQLGILNKFDFIHAEEDSFNHGVGKVINDKGKFFDWSCDTTIMVPDPKTREITVPVINTINYPKLLKKYPVGTVLLMTDPDADRLVTAAIDTTANLDEIKKLGLVATPLDGERVLVVFTPNQSFLMNMDFQHKALTKAGLWSKYNWFIIKTTASQHSWDEWAGAKNIPVVNTPVGFKELADSMINTERKMQSAKGHDIFLKDVFGTKINLGKKPRLLFAGEESGGEIYGPSDLIKSKSGRVAISMREKSAGEAVIITSAMVSWLEERGISLADYFSEILDENNIKSRFEIRVDQKYYNESEPDISLLLKAKAVGMRIKTLNNSYFLALALGYRDGIITLEKVKEILKECFPRLDFSDLTDIKFCGDGTYISFTDKFLEIRPSGTDAINKAYSFGINQWECVNYAKTFAEFEGKRNKLHKKYIPEKFFKNVEKYSFEVYTKYKLNQ